MEFHLEGHHMVHFEENNETGALASATQRTGTKLTEWFAANLKYPGAKQFRYDDFEKYFTWQKPQNKWKPRSILRVRNRTVAPASSSTQPPVTQFDFTRPGVDVVSRLYTVGPREDDRYFLQMLLFYVPEATYFQNLHTIQGV